jgi:transcriptional regulator with XRE-family HTH domain
MDRMDKIPEEFLSWLNKNLEANNLSQSEASRRAGLNQNAISDIVNGKVREASLRTCKALARLFNTPLEEVLRLAGHIEYSEDMALKELMEVARSLTPEDHRELLEYARWRYSRRAREEEGIGGRSGVRSKE